MAAQIFQSALPRGERLGGIIRTAQGKGISIRAPTRGATVSKCTQRGGNVFQSALPRGERQMLLYTVACVLIFQSALPRGERLYQHFYFLRMCTISIRAPTRGATICRLVHKSQRTDFNPRSHEGSDLNRHFPCTFFAISIRAPTRGATFCAVSVIVFPQISIRAPTRGATIPVLQPLSRSIVFQSALPRGERQR